VAKIAIVRNVHPNEAVAFHMARKVAEELRRRGHEVKLHTIDFRKTLIGKAMLEPAPTISQLRGAQKGLGWEDFETLSDSGYHIVDFHNTPDKFRQSMGIRSEMLWGVKRTLVEIPAVYAPLRNKRLAAARDRMGFLAKRALPERDRWYAKFILRYLEGVANLQLSKKAGYASPENVSKIADQLEARIAMEKKWSNA
jgi:hypothetical protein